MGTGSEWPIRVLYPSYITAPRFALQHPRDAHVPMFTVYLLFITVQKLNLGIDNQRSFPLPLIDSRTPAFNRELKQRERWRSKITCFVFFFVFAIVFVFVL